MTIIFGNCWKRSNAVYFIYRISYHRIAKVCCVEWLKWIPINGSRLAKSIAIHGLRLVVKVNWNWNCRWWKWYKHMYYHPPHRLIPMYWMPSARSVVSRKKTNSLQNWWAQSEYYLHFDLNKSPFRMKQMNNFVVSVHDYFSHNTEKVIYFLLLERKRRRPALEDEEEVARPRNNTEVSDPPKKRLDTCRINGQNSFNFGQISEGSPITTRRQAFKYVLQTLLADIKISPSNHMLYFSLPVSDLTVIHVIITEDLQHHHLDRHHIIVQLEIHNKVRYAVLFISFIF